mmetsp:Transcript_22011/g.61588  ORF Transcript_22011/g.61588 Transcript_22011/m.61588 type:complete len:272 (-) Transcript_22011:7-822(-)
MEGGRIAQTNSPANYDAEKAPHATHWVGIASKLLQASVPVDRRHGRPQTEVLKPLVVVLGRLLERAYNHGRAHWVGHGAFEEPAGNLVGLRARKQWHALGQDLGVLIDCEGALPIFRPNAGAWLHAVFQACANHLLEAWDLAPRHPAVPNWRVHEHAPHVFGRGGFLLLLLADLFFDVDVEIHRCRSTMCPRCASAARRHAQEADDSKRCGSAAAADRRKRWLGGAGLRCTSLWQKRPLAPKHRPWNSRQRHGTKQHGSPCKAGTPLVDNA